VTRNVNQDLHRSLMRGGLTPDAAGPLASDSIQLSWVAKTGNLGVANNVNPPGIAILTDGYISYMRARVGTAPATTAINLRVSQVRDFTADTSGFVASTAMKNGSYTLKTVTPPGDGARIVTCTRTVVGGTDTAGTITVTGTDLTGAAQQETLTPGANGVLVSGTKYFKTVTDISGSGWTTATGDDTIVCGWAALSVIGLVSIAAATTSGLWTTGSRIQVISGDVIQVDVTQIGTGTVGADLALDING
jgi:hypothetical protein